MGARSEEFKADEIIIKEGTMSSRMYIVLEGDVILYSNYGTENEYVIGVYGRGKTFGEFNLFTNEPNLYTAVAYNFVKVAWFEKNNLSSFINGYPDSALNMFETFSKSYIIMAKNLQLAINEINTIREQHPEVLIHDTRRYDEEEVAEALQHLPELKGSYHFIRK